MCPSVLSGTEQPFLLHNDGTQLKKKCLMLFRRIIKQKKTPHLSYSLPSLYLPPLTFNFGHTSPASTSSGKVQTQTHTQRTAHTHSCNKVWVPTWRRCGCKTTPSRSHSEGGSNGALGSDVRPFRYVVKKQRRQQQRRPPHKHRHTHKKKIEYTPAGATLIP